MDKKRLSDLARKTRKGINVKFSDITSCFDYTYNNEEVILEGFDFRYITAASTISNVTIKITDILTKNFECFFYGNGNRFQNCKFIIESKSSKITFSNCIFGNYAFIITPYYNNYEEARYNPYDKILFTYCSGNISFEDYANFDVSVYRSDLRINLHFNTDPYTTKNLFTNFNIGTIQDSNLQLYLFKSFMEPLNAEINMDKCVTSTFTVNEWSDNTNFWSGTSLSLYSIDISLSGEAIPGDFNLISKSVLDFGGMDVSLRNYIIYKSNIFGVVTQKFKFNNDIIIDTSCLNAITIYENCIYNKDSIEEILAEKSTKFYVLTLKRGTNQFYGFKIDRLLLAEVDIPDINKVNYIGSGLFYTDEIEVKSIVDIFTRKKSRNKTSVGLLNFKHGRYGHFYRMRNSYKNDIEANFYMNEPLLTPGSKIKTKDKDNQILCGTDPIKMLGYVLSDYFN